MVRPDSRPDLAPLLGLCLLLLSACRAEPAPPAVVAGAQGGKAPAVAEVAAPPAEQLSTPATEKPRLLVGRRDANGEIASQSAFEGAEPPAFQIVGGTRASETLEVVWYDAGDTVIHRQSVPLVAGRSVRLDFQPPGGWAPGLYRFEARRGQEVVAEEPFEIVENAVIRERPGI